MNAKISVFVICVKQSFICYYLIFMNVLLMSKKSKPIQRLGEGLSQLQETISDIGFESLK